MFSVIDGVEQFVRDLFLERNDAMGERSEKARTWAQVLDRRETAAGIELRLVRHCFHYTTTVQDRSETANTRTRFADFR